MIIGNGIENYPTIIFEKFEQASKRSLAKNHNKTYSALKGTQLLVDIFSMNQEGHDAVINKDDLRELSLPYKCFCVLTDP